MIDDIGVVSSVSGGSVIAAHFALFGPAGLDRFGPDFLVPDNTRTLGLDAVNPITWLQLAITGSSRIDLVEELFDRQLFKGKTFYELNQPGKPYLILNATDMASGEVFAFTPKRFDDICSDLDKEPISAGVAASAAIPIVFSTVAFQNFSARHCRDWPTPQWITTRLDGRYARYLNLETFQLARYANDLRPGRFFFISIHAFSGSSWTWTSRRSSSIRCSRRRGVARPQTDEPYPVGCSSPGFRIILSTSAMCCSSRVICSRAYSSSHTLLSTTSPSRL